MSDQPKTRSQIIEDARKFPIPNRWKPVEVKKPEKKVDLAPYFRDWVTCPDCKHGVIENVEQKNGYSVKTKTKCQRCKGQGGWHTEKDKPCE